MPSQTYRMVNPLKGSNSFDVPAVGDYVASPGSGSLVVNGSAEVTPITCAPQSSVSPTFFGLPEDLGYSLLGDMVGFAGGWS